MLLRLPIRKHVIAKPDGSRVAHQQYRRDKEMILTFARARTYGAEQLARTETARNPERMVTAECKREEDGKQRFSQSGKSPALQRHERR